MSGLDWLDQVLACIKTGLRAVQIGVLWGHPGAHRLQHLLVCMKARSGGATGKAAALSDTCVVWYSRADCAQPCNSCCIRESCLRDSQIRFVRGLISGHLCLKPDYRENHKDRWFECRAHVTELGRLGY